MLRQLAWISFFLSTSASPTIRAQARATVTPPPSLSNAFSKKDNNDNPLSNLISNGIAAGNSLLSEILPPESSLSQTSVQSRQHTTMISSFDSSRVSRTKPLQSPSTRSSAPLKTPLANSGKSPISPGSNNNILVIVLAVVLGFLAVALIAVILWLCMRRRKRRNERSEDEQNPLDARPKPSIEDQREHNRVSEPSPMRRHTIPPPSVGLLGMSRDRGFQTTRSSASDTDSSTPFFTPPVEPREVSTYTSQGSRMSTELDGTPISPITPTEPLPALGSHPVEMDGTGVPWLPRKSSGRGKRRVLYPPPAESSRFDFGFGWEGANGDGKRHGLSKIPRRPLPH